jgi:hypothetical protein
MTAKGCATICGALVVILESVDPVAHSNAPKQSSIASAM